MDRCICVVRKNEIGWRQQGRGEEGVPLTDRLDQGCLDLEDAMPGLLLLGTESISRVCECEAVGEKEKVSPRVGYRGCER